MSARRFDGREIAEARSLEKLLVQASRDGEALKRDGDEWVLLCPFHKEKTPSCRIYPDGHFYCFGCGAHGDAPKWRMLIYGETFPEAVAVLLGRAPAKSVNPDRARPQSCGAAMIAKPPPDWVPIAVPGDALPLVLAQGRTRPIFNPKRSGTGREWVELRPTLVHEYAGRDGSLRGYVLRVDGNGGKFTPTVTYCRNRCGERRWCLVSFADPRPLYRLVDIEARPSAKVLLVEGEKTADAAATLFPDRVAVTWPGGSKAYAHANWPDLAGCAVTCIPDADDPGIEAFTGRIDDRGERIPGILDRLVPICASVEFVTPPADLPDGWDLADGLMEGWDRGRANEWLSANVRPVAAADLAAPALSEWQEKAARTVAGRNRTRTAAKIADHLLRRNVDPFLAAELVSDWQLRRCEPPLAEDETLEVVNAVAMRALDRERRRGR